MIRISSDNDGPKASNTAEHESVSVSSKVPSRSKMTAEILGVGGGEGFAGWSASSNDVPAADLLPLGGMILLFEIYPWCVDLLVRKERLITRGVQGSITMALRSICVL